MSRVDVDSLSWTMVASECRHNTRDTPLDFMQPLSSHDVAVKSRSHFPIVLEELYFVIRRNEHRRVISRCRLNGLPGQRHGDRSAMPIDVLDTGGLYQRLFAREPIPRVHFYISDFPVLVVDDQVFDMADSPS